MEARLWVSVLVRVKVLVLVLARLELFPALTRLPRPIRIHAAITLMNDLKTSLTLIRRMKMSCITLGVQGLSALAKIDIFPAIKA